MKIASFREQTGKFCYIFLLLCLLISTLIPVQIAKAQGTAADELIPITSTDALSNQDLAHLSEQDWQVTFARQFNVGSLLAPGNIYIASGMELVPDPNHAWPPVEGDKLIGRFTLGNNGGQTLRLEGYGIRMRRNNNPNDYWDFLNTTARDLAPGQTVRFDQNNERPLATGHYRAEITWKISGQDWRVTSAREFDVPTRPNPGNIYVASDIELVPEPNHGWPPNEGDKLVGRFTLGNNGGQTLRLEGYGIRMRRNNNPADYWDFLYPGGAIDLAPGQTVRFDQNNERALSAGHYRAEITWRISGQDWQVTSAREFDVPPKPAGNIYVASDIELVPDPNHAWPPVEGDKLIGRFTLGNNGGQTLRLEGYGIRMRRDNNPNDYWDFLNTTARDLAPGETVRFDQNNERPLATGHYRAEITWKVSGQDWQVTSAREFDVPSKPQQDNAIFVDQSNSPTVVPGQYFQIWFDIQNAGTSTWTGANNYYLENSNGVPLGAPSQLNIRASVPSQANYRWNITMQAPATTGSYTTQWRMKHGDTAFGPTLSITVTVADASTGTYDLRVTQSLSFNPSSPNTAQSVTAQYTLHNFGSQTAYLRLVGIGGRGPNGDSDIEDYPWLENISLAPNSDLAISKTRGFAQDGIYTFFPVYQLSDGTWHELKLQSGEAARKFITVSGNTALQSFDTNYQYASKEVMPITAIPKSYPADGSIIADVSIRNPKNIPTMMTIKLFGNVSQPSGYLEKISRIGTIPVGPNSTVTFHDVHFYPGSQIQIRFAAWGNGTPQETELLAAYHITEILSISVLGWIPSGDDFEEVTGLLDGELDLIADAMKSVNLQWFNIGQKLGRGDIDAVLKDLPGLAENYSGALSNLSGKILKRPLPASGIKNTLKSLTFIIRFYDAYQYLRDLYQSKYQGIAQADIIASTRSAMSQAMAESLLTTDANPQNLAAAENGALVVAASSEHTSGWEQHRMIDGNSSLGWGSANESSTGQWSVIRLANKTPALLSSIAINPGPAADDPSSAAIKNFHVDASIDGVNFTTVLTGTFSSTELGQMKTFPLTAVVAEYVRLVIDSNQGEQAPGIFGVVELDVRGVTYAPDDAFEPDASYVQATPIDKDVSQSHTLSFPGDEDFFRFYGQSTMTYMIATTNLDNNTDAVLDLYDQDGVTLIASSNNSNSGAAAAITWMAPSDGYYFVRVRQQDPTRIGDNENYSIRISVVSPPSPPSNPNPADGATVDRTADITFSWNTDGTSCDIHIWNGSSIDTTQSGISCSSFLWQPQWPGTYQWQVTAHNSSGNTTGPTWHFNLKPYAPTNLNISSSSPTEVTLNWTLSTDEPNNIDEYDIYQNDQYLGSVTKGISTYTVRELTCDGSYTFYVRSKRQGVLSDASNTVTREAVECAKIINRNLNVGEATYFGFVTDGIFEKWRFEFTETHSFIFTASPIIGGLVPRLILLDANDNELARGTNTLTSTQPAGTYYIQVQPEAGSGIYSLTLRELIQPSVSTSVNPMSVKVGDTAMVTVSLNYVPAEGYTSAEFTCVYDNWGVARSNLILGSLFGADPVMVESPQLSIPEVVSFIVAIAGSNGAKDTISGPVFTFDLTSQQVGVGQISIECKARVSKGDGNLVPLPSTGPATLMIDGGTITPTFTPTGSATPTGTTTSTETPTPSITSTPSSTPTVIATDTPTPSSTSSVTASDTPTPSPPPTATASATPAQPLIGTLTGQLLATEPVIVRLYNATNTLVMSVPANPDGTFSITAPTGTYTVIATASGFLSAQGSFTVTAGNTTTLPTISLLAGDIDNNNVIDQFDAMTIGMNYNVATPSAADLNNDGIINVLDVELLAKNYRKIGPVVWQ